MRQELSSVNITLLPPLVLLFILQIEPVDVNYLCSKCHTFLILLKLMRVNTYQAINICFDEYLSIITPGSSIVK